MGLMGVWNPPSLSCIATLSVFFFFTASLCTAGSISSSLSSDADLLLYKIKPSLQPDPSESDTNPLLATWNATVPLCQWRGLKWVLSTGLPLPCDDLSTPIHSNASLYRDPSLHLLSIHLPSASLAGTVPRELVQLPALRSLSFASNSLSGTVPPELGYSSSLSEIDLANNRLTGPLPPSIWSLCDGALAELRLHGNALSGEVPDPGFSSNSTICSDLRALDLGQNRFSGEFPEFVTRLSGLVELDLGDNLLSGTIPDGLVGLKSLKQLNLSHNNFSGVLPVFPHSNYEAWAFEGNSPDLCGPPLGSCKGKSSSTSGLSAGAVAAIVISLMTGAVVFASLMIGYSQGKRRKRVEEDEIEDGEEYEDENSSGIGGGAEGKLLLFQGGEHLTLEDVLNATGQVTEKTSYGTVYKAKLADGGTIALRLLREGSCVDQSSCLTVIRQLGRIRHENLIPLRAFYQGNRGEKLLIYDYLPTKTLHDLLHDSKAGKTLLNWGRRHKIALGVARGLAHLHTGLETPMVHGNVRSKNVLVDDFFVTRITEFGLDKLMIPSIADEVVALAKSDGYKAPELQRMKKCNSRTDVYAFGILLLEILIGKKPGKNGKSGELVDLPSMVKAAVLEETTMEVFDPEVLKGMRSPMEDGLVQALKLAMGCCAPVASVRPAMDEVVRQLEENRPRNRSALYSPTETRSEIGTPF